MPQGKSRQPGAWRGNLEYQGWTRREVAMMIETKRLRALNRGLFQHIEDLTKKIEG